MLVRRKQKPKDDQRLVPHRLPWQVTECERRGLSNSGTEELAKFSKLSAKMVELSLQETRRNPTVGDTVPNELSAVSSPLLWPSTCVHTIAPPAESAGRVGTAAQNPAVAAATPLNQPRPQDKPCESRRPDYLDELRRTLGNCLARARVIGSAAVRNLGGYSEPIQKAHQLATFRARIFGSLVIAAQRSGELQQVLALIRKRTAPFIARWTQWVATTAQFLAARKSAKRRLLKRAQSLQRLRYRCANNFRLLMARAPAFSAVMVKRFAEFKVRRDSFEGDSRLWTFIGMAALLSLLTVAVISSVPHYTPTHDTTKHIDQHTPSNVSSSVPATQGILQPHRNPVAYANSTAANAVVPHPARTFLAPKSRIRKTQLREDDDYVAQDTYVYYGNKGKPAR
jgi:hypothetical protein